MDKEVAEVISALKEITKLKELMVERLKESKFKTRDCSESISKINEQLKSLYASGQSVLLKSSGFQDKKILFRKLLEYKSFDINLSESFQGYLEKESLIESSGLLQKINDHIDEIQFICAEISDLDIDPNPQSSLLKISSSVSDNSIFSSLDQILIICIFIILIFICLLVLKPYSYLNNDH